MLRQNDNEKQKIFSLSGNTASPSHSSGYSSCDNPFSLLLILPKARFHTQNQPKDLHNIGVGGKARDRSGIVELDAGFLSFHHDTTPGPYLTTSHGCLVASLPHRLIAQKD